MEVSVSQVEKHGVRLGSKGHLTMASPEPAVSATASLVGHPSAFLSVMSSGRCVTQHLLLGTFYLCFHRIAVQSWILPFLDHTFSHICDKHVSLKILSRQMQMMSQFIYMGLFPKHFIA